jgi:hypothetical protein
MARYSNCQTCGQPESEGRLVDAAVNSPLLDGTEQWDAHSLCGGCLLELYDQGRIGSMFDLGRRHRRAGFGCLSANGSYVTGFHYGP